MPIDIRLKSNKHSNTIAINTAGQYSTQLKFIYKL